MKTKKNTLSFVLVVVCLFSSAIIKAQISPPGTYTTLPNNSSVQTQTLSSTAQWFKYTTDSTHTVLNLKMLQQGSQYALSTVELYRFDGTNLNFVFLDSLHADSSMYVYATDLSTPQTLYFKVTSIAQVCGTCSGALYPVVSVNVYALPVGCFNYVQPNCQVVQDGGFEYSKLPCVATQTYNVGACNNDPYVGFSSCFWTLPNAGTTIACGGTLGNVPSVGTSDYYYICNGAGNGAHSGNGYAGAYFYTQTTAGTGYAERGYREYISEAMNTPLVAGKTYTMTMWVKRDATYSFATSNIQVLFNNTALSQTGFNAIVSPAGQIVNMASSPVTSTSWVQLSATFVAGANYSRMTFGNYVPVGSSNASNQNPSQNVAMYRSAYYFIDDVSIKPINSITVTPNPAVACAGSPTILTANMLSSGSYTWTPLNPDPSLSFVQPDWSVVSVSPNATTQYLVQGTDAIGCYAYTHATVTIIPQPLVAVTPSNTSICGSGSATLTASGATTYTWSTGATGTSITVTPTATTVYTVTGTTGSCPPDVATATVNVYPTLTVTAAPNVTSCPGANTSLTVAGGSGSYSWSPGGATTASIVVSPSVPVVYTVTSAAAGCTLTATALVNPIACCSVSTAVTFTATSGNLNGGTFNLNSPLTLTSDLTLDNITIFMGTNAEIIVPNNVKFTLNQCHFLGCPQMWKGIRFTGPNGNMTITKNSLIEDAITALDVSNVTAPYNSSDIFFIENSTFNKNHTAISAANYNTNSGNYPMKSANMVFTSRKLYTPDHRLMNPALPLTFNWPTDNTYTLKGFPTIPNTFTPDLHLQTGYEFSVATYSTSNMEVPNAGSVAHQGIRLLNIYSTNSSYNGFRMTAYEAVPYVYSNFDYYNVFDNMHYGINAENSNVMVAHAAFQNMSQYVTGTTSGGGKPFKFYDGGIGINSISSMANGLGGTQTFSLAAGPIINGFNKSTNFFFNNSYGIKTENIQYMTVAFNIIHSNRIYTSATVGQYNAPVGKGEYGVYVKSVDYRGINVKRNFAANLGTGIVFIANTNPFMGSIQLQYVGAVNIQSNTLKANYGNSITASQSMKQGIATDNILSPSLLNGTNVPIVVSGNTIDKAFSGISALNWNKQRIFDNSNTVILTDNGVNSQLQFGIQHHNNLGDNVVSNNIKGFNTTKQRVHGIVSDENKGQSLWCNYTENSYYGTSFSGSQNLTSWKQNTMTSHQRAMLLDNTTIGTQGASGQPINNTWAGSWTGAYKTYVNGTIDPGSATGNSKLYLSTLPANSENGAAISTFRYKTTVPQSLFLTTGSSGVSCPYVPSGLEPVMFTGYQENLDNIVTDAYEYATYLTGNRKNGKLAVYRALLEDSTLLATDTILQNFKASADADNIGKFFAVEQYLSEADYTNAETTLSGISPADSVEIGLKKLYRIYLHTKSDTYDSTVMADLIVLANSCPMQMGIGVYQARVLLNSIYDVYFHYESDCGDTNNVAYRKIRQNPEQRNGITPNNFTVYPNPSSGVIYFTASNMGVESYKVTVHDISGKVIFMKEYSGSETVNSIDLNLSNGVYLMQLTDKSNGEVYKQKFVIQK